MKTSAAVVRPLEEVLQYQNDNVIDRFVNAFAVPEAEAALIFNETKKWLWLCGKSFEENVKDLYIAKDLAIVDEMWHTFLMFTMDYTNFCNRYFNTVIHHIPVTKSEKQALKQTFDSGGREQKLLSLQEREDRFFEYVYDKLGKETVDLWFLEFPQKYPKKRINELFRGVYPEVM